MQGVWRLLGPLGSVFGILFRGLYPERSPKGLLEGTELDFGSILEGTALDFGAILEGTELDFGSIYVDNLGVLFGAHVCVFLRILTCMLITSTFCFGAKSKIIENPNASLEQNSRPTMPFRLMAVLHCLRTSELSVKLLRIR